MNMKKWMPCLLALFLCCASTGHAQNHLDELMKNLEGIASPLDLAVLVSLDDMHDYKKRTDAILKILEDRSDIHSRPDTDYFVKTEIVRQALYLLDEYDLPMVDDVIRRLDKEGNWEKRERALLAFLSAKRNIQYDENLKVLMEDLFSYEESLNNPANRDVVWTMTDVANCLSYLGELFIRKGDERVLGALFRFSSVGYGYPAEYACTWFVKMFLRRPHLFVSSLEANPETLVHDVTTSLIFGIRSDALLQSVEEVLQHKLDTEEDKKKKAVALLANGVEALRRSKNRESGPDPE